MVNTRTLPARKRAPTAGPAAPPVHSHDTSPGAYTAYGDAWTSVDTSPPVGLLTHPPPAAQHPPSPSLNRRPNTARKACCRNQCSPVPRTLPHGRDPRPATDCAEPGDHPR